MQVIYTLVFAAILPRRQAEAPSSNGQQWAFVAQYQQWLAPLTVVAAILLHAARLAMPSPPRYPWLHDRAFITFSNALITGAMVYLNWRQYNQGKQRHVKAQ